MKEMTENSSDTVNMREATMTRPGGFNNSIGETEASREIATIRRLNWNFVRRRFPPLPPLPVPLLPRSFEIFTSIPRKAKGEERDGRLSRAKGYEIEPRLPQLRAN